MDNDSILSDDESLSDENHHSNIKGPTKRKREEIEIDDAENTITKKKKIEFLEEIIKIPEEYKTYLELEGINPILTKDFYLKKFFK